MGIVRTGWRVLCGAVKTFLRKDGFDLAASVSFYSVLSAFPFLFLAIYIVGTVLGTSEEFVRGVTMLLKQIRPYLADFFLEELRNITIHSSSLGWFGFGFLLWTATLIFHSLERAFDEIFETHKGRHFIHSVFCSLIMIPIMGALLFGAVVIITILKAMSQFQVEIVGGSFVTPSMVEMGIGRMVPILLVIVSFTALYKFVPAAKVPFKYALLGGVLGTVLWETAMRIFISYALTAETYGTVFGSFKTAIVILFAFYYSACVLLFCGAIVAQCSQRRR
ncbi:MAG: YihY/virulence factor BrkB family protein [Thermodesulfobacteriota bacterium]